MNSSITSNPIRHTPITSRQPVLKVLGLGGGGCNAINRMIELDMGGVTFIAANTDHQALSNCLAPIKIMLGPHTTRGLGAGGKPEVGEAAAEESYREIAAALNGADMVFLAAGMGGGTGTGSISIGARVARALGAVTIAVVTTPFSFEAGRRQRNAQQGLEKLRRYTNTLITVPNDRLLHVATKEMPLEMAFRLADDVLRQGIQGIAELITETGLINVDFAHIRRLMELGGGSLMSIGHGSGDKKAFKAITQALHHPLLESVSLDSAVGMIANFTGGSDLTFLEVTEALNYLQEQAGNKAEIIPGVITDDRMEDRAQVILIITGLGATPIEQTLEGAERMMPATYRPQLAMHAQPVAAAVPSPMTTATRIVAGPMATSSAQSNPPPLELSSTATNLDIPAFMRRRYRNNG